MNCEKDITRSEPGAFLFLIDQSGSMAKEFGKRDENGRAQSKAEAVADAVNRALDEIILSCLKQDGLRDYFEIGMIGYGQHDVADFCWEGDLAGERKMVPVSKVRPAAQIKPVVMEKVTFGQLEKDEVKLNVWLKPTAVGATPMKSAFGLARSVLESWIGAHPNSNPPIVINITDGEATDINSNDELIAAATSLTSLKNNEGCELLLINCHISGLSVAPVLFPSRSESLPPDPYAQALFQMSSTLPPKMARFAAEMARSTGSDPVRGMVFNGNGNMLIKCLQVGTVPTRNIGGAPAASKQ